MYWDLRGVIIDASSDGFKRLSSEDAPLIAEIGFGNGEFMEHIARRRPDALVVGFDVSQICAAKAARRALASGMDNLRIVRGDARFLLSRVFEPSSVDQVYMNFPCPWPKKRHEGRRVSSAQFVGALSSCLKVGGGFSLATDVEQYAQETADFFSSHGAFSPSSVICDPPREYATKYERKWREMGRDIYVVETTKINGGLDVRDIIDEEDREEMPTPTERLSWAETCERLNGIRGDEIKGDGSRAVIRDVFISDAGAALVLIISVDEGFEQHFYIKATESAGAIRGQIDPVGRPYRTPGVRACMRYLARRAGLLF